MKPEGLGGQFAGNSIHKIISEEGLQGLRKFIQDKEVIEPVIEYLRSIRILYQMSVAEELDPKYECQCQIGATGDTGVQCCSSVECEWHLRTSPAAIGL